MLGERSTFDFALAESLGKSLGEVRGMPHAELVEWAAFYRWRGAMREIGREV